MTRIVCVMALSLGVAAPALARQTTPPPAGAPAQQAAVTVPWNDRIPPGTPEHVDRALKESSRHGEWVDITVADGTKLKSYVIYPERPDKSGVVLVIHDIRGMSDWARALGDQLAQDGFIAIVPDFLSGKGPDGGGTASLGSAVGTTIQALTGEEMTTRLNAAMAYGRKIPSSNGKTAVIGFCWGGTQSFNYAIAQPDLAAAVVYYGNPTAGRPSPDVATEADYAKIKAPVIGMYGGNDSRIDSSIPATEAAMKKLGKFYEKHIFDGAGHGFLGSQAGANGANLKAAEQAWPLTIDFLKEHLK